MLRQLYTVIFRLLLPFLLLRLFIRGLRVNRAYWQRWSERLGWAKPPSVNVIIHAVSLGETIAAVGLIKALRAADPSMRVLLTCTTLTGSARAQAFAETDPNVFHCYLPYDLPGALRRFLRASSPQAFILMETELWPNVIFTCHDQKIPVIVANARLSERSAAGYAWIRFLLKRVLSCVHAVLAQGPEDAKRFVALGLPINALHIVGNIKFDLTVKSDHADPLRDALRQQLSSYSYRWIAASTHPGEEEIILAAHRAVLRSYPNTILILVPRHPERALSVKALCEREGFVVTLHSQSRAQSLVEGTSIYLVDTTGELLSCFAVSDCAFVGGSLVPIGGHNILEPIACDVPTLSGPHVMNFIEIIEQAKTMGAVEIVEDGDNLAAALCVRFADPDVCETFVNNGRHLLESNQGATVRHVALIRDVMR